MTKIRNRKLEGRVKDEYVFKMKKMSIEFSKTWRNFGKLGSRQKRKQKYGLPKSILFLFRFFKL